MKKQEIIAKLERAIEKCKRKARAFDGSDNPQLVKLCIREEAKLEAFESVLFAMRGNGVYLNVEAS